jgi:O-antigen ligase
VRDALRRLSLERLVQLALAAVVLTTVLAAGAVLEWIPVAKKLRWAALLALAVLAALYALRARGRGRLDAAFAPVAALLAVGVVSAAWSATPKLTAGRAIALGIVLVVAACLAFAAAARPATVEAVLDGLLLGATAVAVGGLLVLAFRHDRAVQAATTVSPARYQGLGGGPNMAPMVMALALPIAAHILLGPRRLAVRVVAAGVLALLLGSIVFSGSRGALAAAFAGLFAYALLGQPEPRRRVAVALGVGVLLAASLGIGAVPSTAAVNPPEPTGLDPNPTLITPTPGYIDVNVRGLRLQDDVGHPGVGVADTQKHIRGLLGSSGRSEAWAGAIAQALKRPLAGYGFGTEDRVFVDRYVFFNSNVPENSYIGLFLQLGIVGLALLGAFAVFAIVRALRTAGGRNSAACASVVAAGLVLALFQSYLYAAGNNATAAFWISGFLLFTATADAA